MKMNSRIVYSSVIVLLALLAITEGMSLSSPGANLRCRCIKTESQPIGRYIAKWELFPADSHCSDTEIIGTLRQSGDKVCLDPSAPWVKRVIKKMLANKPV